MTRVSKHTMTDLKQMQSLPLSDKIKMTERRIQEWIDEFGTDGVYVSFSGGKDSTVLVDIVRNRMGYKEIPLVFVDVPTQYPELKEFVKRFDNIVILSPRISFMDVCAKYGFPLISKETADIVADAKKYFDALLKRGTALAETKKIPYACAMADLIGIDCRTDKNNDIYRMLREGAIPHFSDIYEELKNNNIKVTAKTDILFGKYIHKEHGVPTDEYSKQYDKSKYSFMLDAPFLVSGACCREMKKKPIHQYSKETGRQGITAQMADESRLRASTWMKNGCNAFNAKDPVSNPLSVWLEQDILKYIKENNLPICSVYGDVIYDEPDQCDGQMSIIDYGLAEENRTLRTTGCSRTGCMLCGFGCHLEKSPNRFEMLHETHPKMYALLDVVKNNGVTMREAIEWINEYGNMNIKL